jgi:hypothetical protein
MNRSTGLLAVALVVVPALLRAVTHYADALPNVAPAAAVALFCGAVFRDRWLALVVPLASMLLGDVLIDWDWTEWGRSMAGVYLSIAGISALGVWVRSRERKPVAVLCGALGGSLLFFLVTNFQYWLMSDPSLGIYHTPRTFAGFVQAYAQALPFYRASLIGDVLYSFVLFGAYALAAARSPEVARSAA